MKATVTYNQRQAAGSSINVNGLMNVVKGIIVAIAVVGILNIASKEYTSFSSPAVSYPTGLEIAAQEGRVFEMALPEVVITPQKQITQDAIYLLSLPEVVITPQKQVTQEAIYELALPEVVITPNKQTAQEATYELSLPEVVIVVQRPANL